ncbi:MAG: hypothetical protein KDC84_11090 [Crocinitomicaceae bacterium]|nr:hypothetical protein [Crocinitomicaceae bacterium]
MLKHFVYLNLIILLVACSESSKEEQKTETKEVVGEMPAPLEYFYPKDTTVYMYVYQNTKNPDDQYIERVMYKEVDGVDHFFVSRYDARMNPIFTMSYWVLEGNIELMKANMVIGRVPYESKIKNGFTFPTGANMVANTTYDFPVNDSIIQVIEINRKFKGLDTLNEGGLVSPCIVFKDSVRTTYVDIKNEQHTSQPGYLETYFEKGIGKILEKNDRMGYRLIMRTTADQFAKLQ